MATPTLGRRQLALGGLLGAASPLLVRAADASASPLTLHAAYRRPDPDTYLGSTAWRPSTFMVGDSITMMSHHRLRRPAWEISCYAGRPVDTMTGYVSDRLASSAPLQNVVIALGTNASAEWTFDDLQTTVGLLPSSTRLVLVNVFRHNNARYPASDPCYSPVALAEYSQWYAELAASRPGTAVVDWRSYIRRHVALTFDGTHPRPRAQKVWAQLILSAVRSLRD